jgi:hypothetical protein
MRFAARCALALGYAVSAVALGSVDVSGAGTHDECAMVIAGQQTPATAPSKLTDADPGETRFQLEHSPANRS